MRFIFIPTPRRDQPFLTQVTALGGQEYRLDFAWNARRELWELALFDSEETAVVRCLSVVHGFDLLQGVSAPNRPPGRLICVAANQDAPTLESFETDLLAYFLTELESV